MNHYKPAPAMADDDDQHLTPTLTAVCPRPIPNSYWATPLLLACEYPWTPKNPSKPKLDNLLKAGVRTFIDLTECGELSPYANILSERAALFSIDEDEIEYHRFPIRDRSLPESVDYMFKVFEVLHDNERRGRISAVHCRGGIGRTGMVIGCWLVECGIAKDGEEALAIIAREWRTVEKCKRYPHSPETGPQFEFVRNFHVERHLAGESSGSDDSEDELKKDHRIGVAKKSMALPTLATNATTPATTKAQSTSPRKASSPRAVLRKLRTPDMSFNSFKFHAHSS
ncbi:hypothetical protein AX16_007199 [Volvariella volvacea WC 439]|nr:hypothetical protein AX16_007199 [Volvariella volvacea WC 439]